MASEDPLRLILAAQWLEVAGRTEEAVEILTAVCERWPEHDETWKAWGYYTRPPASTRSLST